MTCCPQCQQLYNPDQTIQRFCRFCETWHHKTCLQPLPSIPSGLPMLVAKNTRVLATWPYRKSFLAILRKLIQRGKNNGIVGNGQLPSMAWEIFNEMDKSNEGPTAKDWNRMDVPVDLLEKWEVTGEAPPQYYNCPTCSSQGGNGFL